MKLTFPFVKCLVEQSHFLSGNATGTLTQKVNLLIFSPINYKKSISLPTQNSWWP
ncbi:MAG: hypothetical protein H0W84_11880 [Bacteroidetes bacterium]|nr:hypothetical protein [Bacteroidota bacterium]